MDESVNVVTLDWRKFGDFSAVGQLTQKIFSAGQGITVHPLQVLDDGICCNVFRRSDAGEIQNVFGRKVAHDAVINHCRKLNPGALYVRLSPHKATLELACKLTMALPHVPLIIHYMDKPSFTGMQESHSAYLEALYRFLALRADSVYTIHKSTLPWLQEEYGCDARVLANFIAKESQKSYDLNRLSEQPLQISYFGSIDQKMNAAAIASVCRVVANVPWVRLSIWSNSGIWGDVKDISQASNNIHIFKSNLDEEAFAAKMAEADLLLLPYNLDAASRDFLKHSFSNKFVDYLEVGGVILCLGSTDIPTVEACAQSGVSLVFENDRDLEQAFASKDTLIARLQALKLEQYAARIKPLKAAQTQLVAQFFDDIKLRAAVGRKVTDPAPSWSGDSIQAQQLAFLIRRKFYDLENGQQQSLSATLMAQLIKAKGYQGFEYEI